MVDAEKALRNVENRKKKPDYNPYDDAEEDEYGIVRGTVEIHTQKFIHLKLLL